MGTPEPEGRAIRFTVTPLGGAGRAVTKIVDAIVRYLAPHTVEPAAPGGPGPVSGEAGPGRWRGRGAQGLGLAGLVTEADLATVLAGRDPATAHVFSAPKAPRAGAPGSASAP